MCVLNEVDNNNKQSIVKWKMSEKIKHLSHVHCQWYDYKQV